MNKIKIKGLDCPNCAKKLEKAINEIDVVDYARIEFLKGEISFETKDTNLAIQEIISVTKIIEPDAQILINKKPKNKNFIINLISLFIGTILGIITLFVDMPTPLFWTVFVVAVLVLGYKTYLKAIKLLSKKIINENLLITLSVIGASCVGEYMEGLMVIWLYTIGKLLESLAVERSRKSIQELTNLKPEYANVLINGKEEQVSPQDVEIGQILIVKSGEKIALDGVIVEGGAHLNTQSLTGESLPVRVDENDKVMSGAIVLDGVLKIKTTTTYSNSTVSKIMDMIENAESKKSKTETGISKISRWYTLGVIACAVLTFGIVYLVTNKLDVSIYRGLIFLVVSCPCAFAISVPLSYFSGLGNASKNGILIKGTNYLDVLAKVNAVAFDKTGTITTGVFEIENIESFKESLTQEDILYLACLGEQNSIHPLAKSILKHNTKELREVDNVKEVAGEGVYFDYDNNSYFVGRKDKTIGATIVDLCEKDDLIGRITLKDKIKDNAKDVMRELRSMGVDTAIISGDNEETVADVAKQVEVGEYHAKMLPADKFKWIENKKQDKSACLAYVGDGINDAPSLMLADVGISMGLNGAEASIEASDVVFGDDNLKKVVSGIKTSKFTRKIVFENIIFSAVTKLTFLVLGALGVTGMLTAVFADVGVTLIAILNSLRALRFKPKDKKDKKR